MSLSLLQGYSSAEEDPPEAHDDGFSSDEEGDSGSDVDGDDAPRKRNSATASDSNRPFFFGATESSNSELPSALAAFSEVSGPPDFLNNSVDNTTSEPKNAQKEGGRWGHAGRKHRKERKDLPAGAVVEAKPHLVGIRERVRSDLDGGHPLPAAPGIASSGEGKRVISAANPEPKDAADLLRTCLQCGVPKTYVHDRGMICPICGDRPPPDPNAAVEKKKGSMIKDKEKSKRIRGQSSHATWKSETEMVLRQQFD